MDRFILKQPTWKTVEASAVMKNIKGIDKTPYKPQQKLTTNKRLSLVDERIMKILMSGVDQPLSSSQNGSPKASKQTPSAIDENTPPKVLRTSPRNHKSKFIPNELNNVKIPKSTRELGDDDFKCLDPIENPAFLRIQRDLNSPSASTRLRAMKALKTSTTSHYNNFDVPYEEQDIITAEERKSPGPPIDIKDVMRDIVVYVEVRTAEDNRSGGVKKVISSLGAQINDKFLRNTTHVVFKDGLQSTYKKAKKWDIPIVSILWIEACKKNLRLMPPSKYPISNLDRYENPELYARMKRMKSMQPDAENKIRRKKVVVPKNVEVVPSPPIFQIPQEIDDNLNNIFEEFHEKLLATPIDDMIPFKSQLLERILNSPRTPKPQTLKPKTVDNSSLKLGYLDCVSVTNDTDKDLSQQSETLNAQKALEFSKPENKNISCLVDNSTFIEPTISEGINQLKLNPLDKSAQTPRRSRRTTLSLYASTPITDQSMKTPRNTSVSVTSTIKKIVDDSTKKTDDSINVDKEVIKNRHTTFTEKQLDMSECVVQETPSNNADKMRRRTLFTPRAMEFSKQLSPCGEENSTPKSFKNCNVDNTEEQLKTPHQFLSVLEDHAATVTFSSTKRANPRRQTMFDISMDIIDQRLHNINKFIKSNTLADEKSARSDLMQYDGGLSIDRNRNETNPIKNNLTEIIDSTKTPEVSKRRKLFVPDQMLMTPPLLNLIDDKTKSSGSSKKIRTEKRNSFEKKSKNDKRRETIGPAAKKAGDILQNNRLAARRSSMMFQNSDEQKMHSFDNNCNINKIKPNPVVVYTNMHSEQIVFIKKAIKTLGNVELDNIVGDNTTHIITLEPRRTINLLKGIVRGLWILSYKWIIDSFEKGKWLDEEQYEIRNFLRAIEICRSERQAFGCNYKMDIFLDFSPIYVSHKCNVPYSSVKELISLCAGSVVEQRKCAKYIIGEYYPDKICVQPQWILDCISCNQVQKLGKYLIRPKN